MSKSNIQPIDQQPDGCATTAAPPTDVELAEAAQRYAALGLHPILLHGVLPGGLCTCQKAGQCPSPGKHPVETGWQQEEFNLAWLCAELCRRPVSNIGLRMGKQPDGTCRVARDIDDLEAYARHIEKHGLPVEDTLTTATGGGGMHEILEVSPEMLSQLGNWVKPDGAGFDLRVEGGQCVAAPSLHASGRRYSSLTDKAIAKMSQQWCDHIPMLKGTTKVAGGSASPVAGGAPAAPAANLQTRRDAMTWLADDAPVAVQGQGGHGTLLHVMGGLMVGFELDRASAMDLARAVYNPRCVPPWEGAELETDFKRKLDEIEKLGSKSYQPGELTQRYAHKRFGELPSGPSKTPPANDVVPAAKNDGEPEPLPMVHAGDLAKVLPPVPWLCKRLDMAPGRPTVVVARAGSGKTLALQSLALAVASGLPVWSAFEVRQGPVLHLDLDQGRYGTQRRYQQLARARGLDLTTLPLACSFFSFSLSTAGQVDPRAVARLKVSARGKALVIIDALRGVAPGLDENDSAFGEILQALSFITDALEQENPNVVPPTFVVLHHAGKGDSSAAGRGTTAIDDRAGVKWVVARAKGSDTATWEQDKVSEFSLGPSHSFSTRAVQGPLDASGAPESVLVEVVPDVVPEAAAAAEATEWEERVARILEVVRTTPGIGSVALLERVKGDKAKTRSTIEALLSGAPECRGARLWDYGGSERHSYFATDADDLIVATLSETLKIECCQRSERVPEPAVSAGTRGPPGAR